LSPISNYIGATKHWLANAVEITRMRAAHFLALIKTKPKTLLKITVITCAVIGLGIGVKLIFFGNKAKKAGPENLFLVKVTRAKKQNYSDTYSTMGSIKGAIENDLRFEIDGILSNYNYKEGDHIEKSKTICMLDPKDSITKMDYANSKFQAAKAAYESAFERLKVYEELFRTKSVSESKISEMRFDVEAAKAQLNAARSEMELASLNLAKVNLVAPNSGVLAEILIKSGEYITPQDVVAKFISGSDTNFEVDIPEKDVGTLQIGQKVKINVDSYPDQDFIGNIAEIAPTVNVRTRTTAVKIKVPNPDWKLRSGMFGRGLIFLSELENVMLVPKDSMVTLGKDTFLVPLLKPDPLTTGEGIVEMRHVKVGNDVAKFKLIEDGILPDEFIITETQGQLSDGIKVKYIEITSQKEPGKEPDSSSDRESSHLPTR
jgi:membrane fusion protein, multidrug efflux system